MVPQQLHIVLDAIVNSINLEKHIWWDLRWNCPRTWKLDSHNGLSQRWKSVDIEGNKYFSIYLYITLTLSAPKLPINICFLIKNILDLDCYWLDIWQIFNHQSGLKIWPPRQRFHQVITSIYKSQIKNVSLWCSCIPSFLSNNHRTLIRK